MVVSDGHRTNESVQAIAVLLAACLVSAVTLSFLEAPSF